ncbi:MAG: hypothetical protein ACREOD_03945 [Candidatus Dormibacteria bacterium]
MPSVSELPPLALVFPAAASLACTALGRPWPRNPGLWARWTVRLGLLLALADAATVLAQLQPGGVLELTLWRIGARLPITLQVDSSGAEMAVVALGAALVVSFAAREARPLASAALGLAALGAALVAFAGDLMAVFIGLQLSALGGVSLSFARRPRAPSPRVLLAAAVDQALALLWLGAIVVVLRGAATLRLAAVPPGVISPALAGLLILPGVARLGSCCLLSGEAGRGHLGRARLVDVADWYTVVALPTGLVLLLRVQELSGGVWPAPWFGTALDLLAVVLGLLAVGWILYSRDRRPELRALPLAALALVLVGFGQNSANGTVVGLGAGLFLELAVAFLPRAVHGFGGGARSPARARLGRAQLWLGGLPLLLPVSLGFAVGLMGLAVALVGGVETGLAPAAAYLLALAVLLLLLPRAWRAGQLPASGQAALLVPALGLLAASIFPGWVVMTAAGALAAPGTAAASVFSAPDPLVLTAPGLIWPGGYLALLAVLVAVGVGALGLAGNLAGGRLGNGREPPRPAAIPRPILLMRFLALGSWPPTLAPEVRSWARLLIALADREVGERPVWLWLGAAAAAAWAIDELIRL